MLFASEVITSRIAIVIIFLFGVQENSTDHDKAKNGSVHGSTFSYGIVQLMMHSLDPVTDSKLFLLLPELKINSFGN